MKDIRETWAVLVIIARRILFSGQKIGGCHTIQPRMDAVPGLAPRLTAGPRELAPPTLPAPQAVPFPVPLPAAGPHSPRGQPLGPFISLPFPTRVTDGEEIALCSQKVFARFLDSGAVHCSAWHWLRRSGLGNKAGLVAGATGGAGVRAALMLTDGGRWVRTVRDCQTGRRRQMRRCPASRRCAAVAEQTTGHGPERSRAAAAAKRRDPEQVTS